MSTQMFPRATASKRFSSLLLLLVPLLPEVEDEGVAAPAAGIAVVCRSPLRRTSGIECRSRSLVSLGARMQLDCCRGVDGSLFNA